jgi:hypothetical protein
MDELCNKFPRVCNCPYKERIDKELKEGKTVYYVCQWLKKTEYTISYNTLKRYYDYLKENGEIKPIAPITGENNCLDEKLTKLLDYALDNVKFDEMNPNVQVQWILGLLKIIRGDKHNLEMDANIKAEILKKLERPIPILTKDDD